jgi:UDP-2,3-diacylglucosamine pyrophosphatase LpxH
VKCDSLILNGDIVDGWALKRGSRWNKQHMRCIRKIMKIAQKTPTTWIRGNHDDFLRDFLAMSLGRLEIKNEMTHVGMDGKTYLVVHGDLFDVFMTKMRWLAHAGSVAYDLALWMNRWYNWYRRLRGLEYFSLSNKLKQSVKAATSFIGKFEAHLTDYARSKNCDGVICGHIHHAEIKTIGGIDYKNSGDFVESLTALVETVDGEWKIVSYRDFTHEYNNYNTM